MRGALEALRWAGLLAEGEAAEVFPLAGGVSSDICGVRTARGAYAIKRSIPKLRVVADWRAPVDRDASEVRWLKFVRALDPRLAPEVVAEIPEDHLFIMRLLNPATHPVWKARMLAGDVDPAFAGEVGRELARIHAAGAGRPDLAEAFATDAAFMALRIDPFRLYTADRHPDVAPRLRALAADLVRIKTTLIQGDISPKNILCGPRGPVFLDAECATYGDPAFDLAFCLTHLLLKSVWVKGRWEALVQSFDNLVGAYAADVDWEGAGALSQRAAALIGALLLARVDGKSPSGYLDSAADDLVRRRAKALLRREGLTLAQLSTHWRGLGAPA